MIRVCAGNQGENFRRFESYLKTEGKMMQVNKYGALSILTPRARGGLFEN
jgi:hypothetical protein